MVAQSDPFAWQLALDDVDPSRRDLAERIHSALERAHAPLRLASIFVVGIAYVLPLLFLQEQVLEAFGARSEGQAAMAIVALLGVSTVVISPLLGYLGYLRAESQTLVEASRRYDGVVLPGKAPGVMLISVATPNGTAELSLTSLKPPPWGSTVVVHAAPEEAHLAAVELSPQYPSQLRIAQLSFSSVQS